MSSTKSNTTTVRQIMMEFANITGLTSGTSSPPKRYLWTDAFAVTNYLQLHNDTNDQKYIDMAVRLVNQVHNVLGRHRSDDYANRKGWISGLSDEEGRKHPTAGGLRIGKERNERAANQAYESEREWSQDGQYFHYNTKWMWALARMYDETSDEKYLRWALELATRSHQGFVHNHEGSKRMYWKMSIDLSRAVVPSMGHHDPLDGLLTYLSLEVRRPSNQSSSLPSLSAEIQDMLDICSGKDWHTTDSLGLGGLLLDVHRDVLVDNSEAKKEKLLDRLISDTQSSLNHFKSGNSLSYPLAYRLAFRELGLSIGLRAMERIPSKEETENEHLKERQRHLVHMKDSALAENIEAFWLKDENQASRNWKEHQGINMVMLATSLEPDGFIGGHVEAGGGGQTSTSL
eukprot:CAMPEP_0117435776 /NCGR_PEP_ID=MMETSP0759-20121206/658_1 /TAXON_ID=63605 /ORGANISM="Percolomonas cosmopolitus, Strain WS" /LENGTH=401 /DNA_ID=CAMNT_0005227339 /DNA_START=336 /DNA_END=1542 /DNA_ORIENTATION=-